MNAVELRKKEVEKLKLDGKKMSVELLDKKLMFKIGKDKDNSKIRNLKKDIARINTILKEKEILNER